MKRILYLSTFKFGDIGAFSGTNRRIFDALKELKEYQIEYYQARPNPLIRFFIRLIGWLSRKLLHKDFQTGLEERYYPSICRRTMRYLKRHDFDAILCWQVAFGFVFAKFSGIKVFLSDASYHQEVDYLRWKVTKRQFKLNNECQKLLFCHATHILMSNHFFDQDIRDYYVSKTPLTHFRFFPSFTDCERQALETRFAFCLVIVCTNYYDKGVPIAIQVVNILRKRGYDVGLYIAGVDNVENVEDNSVIFLGRVNYQNDLPKLYRSANLLILPTLFDCSPLVIPEALSFGVPAVAYATGGVPDYIVDGVTGRLVCEGSGPDAFADIIGALIDDKPLYLELRKNAKEWQEKYASKKAFLDIFRNTVFRR